MARVLVAKTGLDGHWRGVLAVSTALREAGFEVILLGMATADEIASAAEQEDVDLVGLNVGGHISVVERIIQVLHARMPDLPVIAGGTLAPWAVARLAELGVPSFPPGSRLADVVAAAWTAVGDSATQ